jgi:hypothetical protein
MEGLHDKKKSDDKTSHFVIAFGFWIDFMRQ